MREENAHDMSGPGARIGASKRTSQGSLVRLVGRARLTLDCGNRRLIGRRARLRPLIARRPAAPADRERRRAVPMGSGRVVGQRAAQRLHRAAELPQRARRYGDVERGPVLAGAQEDLSRAAAVSQFAAVGSGASPGFRNLDIIRWPVFVFGWA